MKFFVIGCGSIGERHINNLKSIDAGEIVAYDIDTKRRKHIQDTYAISTVDRLETAWKHRFDGVFICTPPSSHISLAHTALKNSAHIFIEKPLSHSMEGIPSLISESRKKNIHIMVGYNFRFNKGIQIVKDLVSSAELGKVLHVKAEFGQYLPTWRPWQNYEFSYTAKKQLGGGILLDGSHEIDYVRWITGEIQNLVCFAGTVSNLKVETEDVADILFSSKKGHLGHIHLDFIRQDYSRTCEIIGELGTIQWNFQDKSVKVYNSETDTWKKTAIKEETNDMYQKEIRHFIKCIKDNTPPLIDINDAKQTLHVALSAKQSVIKNKKVIL